MQYNGLLPGGKRNTEAMVAEYLMASIYSLYHEHYCAGLSSPTPKRQIDEAKHEQGGREELIFTAGKESADVGGRGFHQQNGRLREPRVQGGGGILSIACGLGWH